MAKGLGIYPLTGPSPKGPSIPKGGPRAKKGAGFGSIAGQVQYHNKKGKAGSRAGLRGSPRMPRPPRLATITTTPIPKGPAPFSSVQLPKRGVAAAQQPVAKRPSLLNRIFRRAK